MKGQTDLRGGHGSEQNWENLGLLGCEQWCKGCQAFDLLFIQQIFIKHLSPAIKCCSKKCGYSSDLLELIFFPYFRVIGWVLCMKRRNIWGVALMGRVRHPTLWRVPGQLVSRWKCWWRIAKCNPELRERPGQDVEFTSTGGNWSHENIYSTYKSQGSKKWRIEELLFLTRRIEKGSRSTKKFFNKYLMNVNK